VSRHRPHQADGALTGREVIKKIIFLIGIAAAFSVSACSNSESEALPSEAEETSKVAPSTADIAPGNYDVTLADGSTSQFTMNDDRSYSSIRNGETQTGTLAIVDGKVCFAGDEEGAKPVCWTNGERTPEGTFASVSDDGETVIVKRATPTEITPPAAQ
jgi:hypothetical protein